jgi:hypothetical protein
VTRDERAVWCAAFGAKHALAACDDPALDTAIAARAAFRAVRDLRAGCTVGDFVTLGTDAQEAIDAAAMLAEVRESTCG